jgi:hypothetical protein
MSGSPPERQDDEDLSQIFNWVRKARAEGKKITLLEGTENAIVYAEKSLQKINNQNDSDDCVPTSESLVPLDTVLKHVKVKGNSITNKPTYNFIFNFNFNMPDFLPVINEASKRVPFLKHAVGLTGILALLALVKSYGLSWNVAFWGGMIILGLMAVLFLLSKAVTNKNHPYHRAAFIFVCGMGGLFILTNILLVSCTFFDYPKPVKEIINSSDTKTDSTKTDSAKIAASHVQSTNNTKIIGHVYKSDNSPVENVAGHTICEWNKRTNNSAKRWFLFYSA